MAAAEIAVGASSYQGNAALGGFDAGVIKIDPTPIQQLAQYSFYYNRDMWRQKQKDADDLVAELSKSSELDLNKLIPEERDQVVSKYESLRVDAADIAKRMKGGEDKTKLILEWRDKLKKTSDFVTVANTRYLSKAAREKQIAEETNPEMKSFLQRKLDEALKATTVEQPIPALQSYDLKITEKPAPKSTQFGVYKYDDNSNFIDGNEYTLPDQKDINAKAAQMALGLTNLKVDVNSPAEFLSKSEKDKKMLLEEQEAQTAAGKLAEAAASEHYNAALKQYADGKGNIDINAAKSKNPILAGVMATMDAYNAEMEDMRRRILAGEFTDSRGVKHLDENDYQPISYTDGNISVEDLLKPQIRAKAEKAKVETKITQTDNKIQNQKNAQDYEISKMKANADIIYKKTMAGIAGKKADAYVKNLKQQMALRKTNAEKDALAENLFTHNLMTQQTLVTGNGGNKVLFKIDADNSLPMFTFDGKSVRQLAPIGGTPIGQDGKEIKEGTENAKVAYYKGGYYRTEYSLNGKQYSPQDMADLYNRFKKNNNWQGSFDSFLKEGVKENQFDVKIIGRDGSTDKQVMTAAQRMISNSATSKGEQGVFDAPLDPTIPDDNQEE